MEVHAHSHSHGKKDWKFYFWDFIILFLAVFCGFLAELLLEHKIEKNSRIDYIKGIVENLKYDITRCDKNAQNNIDSS